MGGYRCVHRMKLPCTHELVFTTFLKNCATGESLRTASFLKTVVWASSLLNTFAAASPYCVSVKSHGDHYTATRQG